MSTTAAQQSSRRVTPAAVAPTASAAAREFPVRFNSRRRNVLGWIDAGTVLLDQHGIRVNAKRLTLLGLRRTSRLIEGAAIREVYREGAAIQIDLQADGRRSTCRFCAADARQAAEIVRLLPTSRTIELDGTAPGPAAGPSESDGWSSLWIPLGAVLLVVLAWLGATRLPLFSGALAPEHVRASRSQLPLQSAQVVKRVSGAQLQVESLGARQDLGKFIPRFDALTLQFAVAFEALQLGKLSQVEFADNLQRSLLPQWDALAAELESAADNQGNSVRAEADAALKGAIDSWHQALPTYAHGLRNNDHREVLKAFGYIADAEGYERESRDLLDRLNTP